MLKYLIYLLFFFEFANAMAQPQAEKINQTDSKGLKQGIWKGFHPNGHLKYQGNYKNNLPYGEFKYYFDTDTLKAVLKYLPDGKTAQAVMYAENGKKIAEGQFLDKKRNGLWIFYSEYTGKLTTEETYNNDVKNGLSKTYYEDGKMYAETSYLNNKKNGLEKLYFPNGTLKQQTNYQNDIPTGRYKLFYENGKLEITGEYDNYGNKVGIWFSYDQNGVIKDQIKYEKGRPTGKKAEPTKIEEKAIKVNTPDGIKE